LINFREININNIADTVIARKISEELAENVGFSREKSEKIKLITTELASNLINHKATDGKMRFCINSFYDKNILNITSLDWGPGIKDLTNAIEGNIKSLTGLGRGLASIFRLSDYVSAISNNPLINNSGTIITSCFFSENSNLDSKKKPYIDFFYIAKPWSSFQDSGDVVSINYDARFLRIAIADLPGFSPENIEIKKKLQTIINEIPLFWGVEKLLETLPDSNIPFTAFKYDDLNKQIEFFQKGNIFSFFVGEDFKKELIEEKKGYYHIMLKKISIESDFIFIMHSDGLKTPDFSISNEKCIIKKNNGFIKDYFDIFILANIFFEPRRTNEDSTLMVIKWKK